MELNKEAWDRWVQYRSAIKKPIKEISAEAMKLKLCKMGDYEAQSKIIDQSISNQWQGLFELKQPSKQPYDPHAEKKRTPEQQKAADAAFESALKSNEWGWKQTIKEQPVIGELLREEAILCRIELEPEGAMRDEKVQRLKENVGNLLRAADPSKVLNNLTLRRLVLKLFNDAGLRRLEQRAKEAA
jgi:hypothetical protein